MLLAVLHVLTLNIPKPSAAYVEWPLYIPFALAIPSSAGGSENPCLGEVSDFGKPFLRNFQHVFVFSQFQSFKNFFLYCLTQAKHTWTVLTKNPSAIVLVMASSFWLGLGNAFFF